MDCLLKSTTFTLSQAVEELIKWDIIVDNLGCQTINQKDNYFKFMGIAHCPNSHEQYFKIDIVLTPETSWGASILWFTGSKSFVIGLRGIAKHLGYLLNQHGLFTIKNKKQYRLSAGQQVPVYTEKDIIEFIYNEDGTGRKFVPPEQR